MQQQKNQDKPKQKQTETFTYFNTTFLSLLRLKFVSQL